ncbi:hypothetical protein BGZ94_005949, partial [Podila epigama]
MFSDLDLISENEISEDSSSEDDVPPLLDQNVQKPKPRVRQTPLRFNNSTFTNEIKYDKEVPVKCCAVCCRLLYPRDYCKLSIDHKRKIEEMILEDRQYALAHGKTVPQ